MKKSIFLLIGVLILFSGCAFHRQLTTNLNSNTTEVVLSKKNFKVVDQVRGDARATYFLFIGGLSKKGLVATAKAKMYANANIIGSSKAIINETVEVRQSFFPLIRTHRVFVSGYVIEFTE